MFYAYFCFSHLTFPSVLAVSSVFVRARWRVGLCIVRRLQWFETLRICLLLQCACFSVVAFVFNPCISIVCLQRRECSSSVCHCAATHWTVRRARAGCHLVNRYTTLGFVKCKRFFSICHPRFRSLYFHVHEKRIELIVFFNSGNFGVPFRVKWSLVGPANLPIAAANAFSADHCLRYGGHMRQ